MDEAGAIGIVNGSEVSINTVTFKWDEDATRLSYSPFRSPNSISSSRGYFRQPRPDRKICRHHDFIHLSFNGYTWSCLFIHYLTL